jgi:hypothetical protein
VNLSEHKRTDYFNWQNDINCVLQKSSMFLKDSQYTQRTKSTDNGYTAILALLTDTHPSFVDQPITLAMNWPVETKHNMIFDFTPSCLDHICGL